MHRVRRPGSAAAQASTDEHQNRANSSRIHHITRSVMRCLMVLFTLLPAYTFAQELSAEDRACITAAAGKLPTIAALEIKGSRALARPVQERRNQCTTP